VPEGLQHRRGTEISVPGMDKAAVEALVEKPTRCRTPMRHASSIDSDMTVSKHPACVRPQAKSTSDFNLTRLCRFFRLHVALNLIAYSAFKDIGLADCFVRKTDQRLKN
jgi:hypothetical protein